jgi:cytochrome c oxidase cbb3-type subunit 4
MDNSTLQGLGTVFAMAAFIGVVIWAYSSNKKKDFDEAAQLPFADEDEHETSDEQHKDARSNKQ